MICVSQITKIQNHVKIFGKNLAVLIGNLLSLGHQFSIKFYWEKIKLLFCIILQLCLDIELLLTAKKIFLYIYSQHIETIWLF